MKLVYSSNLDDHIAFNHWFVGTVPNYNSQILCGRILLPLLTMTPLLLLTLYATAHENDPIDIYLGYFIAVMWVFIGLRTYFKYPALAKKQQEKCIRNIYRDGKGEGTIFGRHSLEIIGDKMIEKTPDSETSYKLSSIHKIGEVPTHVFIMLTPSSALAVPRRNIEEGDLDSFVLELKKYLPHTEIT